ncbi:MAG: SUMF1/EgtB/PvdO family nonheme iron enzyme, partial [Planctomycetota bacterium]
TETKYSFGQSSHLLDEYGVTVESNGALPLPVGTKKPNLFGLFDMHGNVWEWCLEPYARDYPAGSRTNPATMRLNEVTLHADDDGVLRGGGADRLPKQARSTHRWTMAFGRNPETAGFRVARTVKGPY